jgi:hypothetical protein
MDKFSDDQDCSEVYDSNLLTNISIFYGIPKLLSSILWIQGLLKYKLNFLQLHHYIYIIYCVLYFIDAITSGKNNLICNLQST